MNSKIPLVDLYSQYKSLKKEINQVITKTIEKSEFINGEDNKLFDLEFAKFCDAKFSIGVGSGSVALDLVLEALEIQQGDEVICPAHTFIATAESISHRGATPIFVDIDETTFTIDPDKIKQKITKKTKAIIAVHMYGNPADMKKISKIARTNKLKIIEDAAQAHGALYMGKKIGTVYSDAAIFSFFPGKNLGCYGDGGAVVTNNKKIADKVRLLKDHGRTKKYEHQILGYGGRLDNLQAAILRVKLSHLDSWNKKRREIAEKYSTALKDKYTVPVKNDDSVSSFYVYTLRHPKRDMILKYLNEKGISTGIYYPIPLHLQPAYKSLGYKKGDLPVTEQVVNEIFSIPLYPELRPSQINKVVRALLSVV